MPDFLVDKSEYVLGIEPHGKRIPEDLERRRALFAGLVRTAAEQLNSAELKSVFQSLASEAERSRRTADLTRQSHAAHALLAFEANGRLVHGVPAVQAY